MISPKPNQKKKKKKRWNVLEGKIKGMWWWWWWDENLENL